MEEQPVTAPQELSAAIDADPAVAAALEANPELRNKVFANARLAARANEYDQVFASPNDARIAAQGHDVYSSVKDALVGIKPITQAGGPEGTQTALNALFAATQVRDEDGNPVLDQNGKPITDGTIGQLLTNAFQFRLLGILNEAKKTGNEAQQAAVDVLMESFGGAPSRPAEEDGDDPLAQERAALQAERAALEEQKTSQKQATQQAFEGRIEKSGDQLVDQAMTSILDRVEGLSGFNRSVLDTQLREKTRDAISKDPYFKNEFAFLKSLPPTAKVEQQRVALISKYLQKHVPLVAKPLLKEAGMTVLAAQNKKLTTTTARQVATQSETRSSGRMPKPAGPMNAQQLNATAIEQLQRELGTSKPSTAAIIARVAQLRAPR